MRDIDVIPHERDATAKAFYKMLDWYLRKNRQIIHQRVQDEIERKPYFGINR